MGWKTTNVFFIIPDALEAMIQAIQAFSLTKLDQRRKIHAQISGSILTLQANFGDTLLDYCHFSHYYDALFYPLCIFQPCWCS